MSQSASNPSEPSKMNKLLSGQTDQSIQGRLPRSNNAPPPPDTPQAAAPTNSATSAKPKRKFLAGYKFAQAFWTIASVISLSVNIGLLIVLLIVLQVLGGPKAAFALAQNQATGLLGGLYLNFVKMDQASIKTTIHVEKEIPVQFSLNVNGPTEVTLTKDVVINGALVTVNTGGLNISRARADIVLPKGTLLPINIENLVVPVDKKVPAVLDVPVDIPLNHTELHEPFIGLQKVVEPYYCFLQPNATVNGINFCSPSANLVPPTEQTTP